LSASEWTEVRAVSGSRVADPVGRHHGLGRRGVRQALAVGYLLFVISIPVACAAAPVGPADLVGQAGVGHAALAGASPAPEVVYVANADIGPVTGYRAGSSGRVHPVRTIRNPRLNGTVWDPWTVTLDSSSNLYVQTFLSDATTFVFHLGSPARLTRVFQVTGPDSQSIAVDARGYEYVMGGEAAPEVFVAAPHASGNPRNQYSVSPVRQFSTGQDGFAPWPGTLATDNHGDVLVAVVKATGNAIEVFHGGPSGSDKPIRTISGPRTGLGSCAGFGACDQVSMAYSGLTGRIYVAVSTPAGAHISVFAGRASGNVRPVRTITGSRTGLARGVITGIADSQRTGDIYVMVKGAQFFAPGSVEVFARLADGNIRPLRTFTDIVSRFKDAEGIAVGG
jgi:hypothetical protein